MSNHPGRGASEPIAIIGSACRLPGGAVSPTSLWRILRDPPDLLTEIPPSRFKTSGFYHPSGSYHGHTNVRHAYLLNDSESTAVASFDASFFSIKPVEAKAMDPQQRFLLEVSYEALEAAGLSITDTKIRGSDTGVYVGVMFNDYATMLLRDQQSLPTYFATGTGSSILSNRLSHFYDWHGPSVTVDTACSSSLVAVHLAVQALRSGDCRMALACGTNLILGPEGFIIESKLNMLSPNGRSYMWDQRADGYARGEGVAALVLKPLSAALEDGDRIESVIRETGINQDGGTPGITVPSALAQETLIRRTYARAGLDVEDPADRPQYFEAHGTGTPVGDAKEAEALYNTFVRTADSERRQLGARTTIYVGSIKTVMGHAEGAAGVAALMKASLALQEHVIPPNILFRKPSERVAPFYKGVEILGSARPWPGLEKEMVRRASVNSFGFGGTNAHAILESYDSAAHETDSFCFLNAESAPNSPKDVIFTPFVFSAASDRSIRALLSAYADFLDDSSLSIRPRDLAWTLRQRRSLFNHRAYFAASTLSDLRDKIKARLGETQEGEQGDSVVGVKALSAFPARRDPAHGGILGIFTGQGAQYARMGASLIEESPVARKIIEELEGYLEQITDVDCRPSWSLKAELLADVPESRVHEAEISQPLCTALQLMMVRLLVIAGVEFSAVVGHSSGEIAAAYAAGYLSARDAMWIAYYRGLHASKAESPNEQGLKGSMLAVGTSAEDMEELCTDERFLGRIGIAAINSSASVTMAGDEDAIAELEDVLYDEHKFYRRLRVDKAYHSAHMRPCFDPYLESLRGLGIVPRSPSSSRCSWFSSVDGDRWDDSPGSSKRLEGLYWAENFTQPVLFSKAVGTALRACSPYLALEIGPHPALQAPTENTIQEVLNKVMPYHGVLRRGSTAIETSSAALGFLWSYLGDKGVRLDKYERSLSGLYNRRQHYQLVKNLPTYPWAHDIAYWHESRSSRNMRSRSAPVHFLLGDATPDSAAYHLRWRNLIRIEEMEWLTGHRVQGQIVFPAAGYIATALEACRTLASGRAIRLIEIVNFVIHQAISLNVGDAGAEVLIEIADVKTSLADDHTLQARFSYSAAVDVQSNDLSLVASADLMICLGNPSENLLPRRGPPLPHTIEVDPERFYSALGELGYDFDGRFRALSSMQRRRGRASCMIKMPPTNPSEPPCYIHPAELDALFQTVLLAYSYPYDEELRTLHLPTTIRRILVNPAALLSGAASRGDQEDFAPADSWVRFNRQGDKTAENIIADVSFYATSQAAHPSAAIQVEGLAFQPLGGVAGEEQDRPLYSKEVWVPATPDGVEAARGLWEDEEIRRKAFLLERIATFYLRKFDREVPLDHPARNSFTTKWYLKFARHVSSMVEDRSHAWWQAEWDEDTIQSVMDASQPHMNIADFQIMHLVGSEMHRVFEGETTMLEIFRNTNSDVLDRFYADGIITKPLAKWVARAVRQITDRYPHMNILEVGTFKTLLDFCCFFSRPQLRSERVPVVASWSSEWRSCIPLLYLTGEPN